MKYKRRSRARKEYTSANNGLEPRTGNHNLVGEREGPVEGVNSVTAERNGIDGRKPSGKAGSNHRMLMCRSRIRHGKLMK